MKDCCRRQHRLKIFGNRSNLSKIAAENEELVKLFQIFERFTNFLPQKKIIANEAKITSKEKRTAIEAVRFFLRTDLEREIQFRRDKESTEKAK
jgi:hypothetical protein